MLRHAKLCLAVICSLPALAGAAAPAAGEAMQRDITALVMGLAERWNSQDYATVMELWDADDPMPMYLAEERDAWLQGWDDLREYLDPATPSIAVQAVREEMYNIRIKPLADDLAIVIWDMHFEMKIIGQEPIGEEIRVTATVRKKPEGWRFIHYAEAPMTTMMYIQKQFQEDVAPGWDAFYEKAQRDRKAAIQRARQRR